MLARRLTLLLSIALAVCLMSAASASATATLIVVTTTDDVDGSACNPAICSLRQAINQANAADSAATIAFNIQSDSVPVIEVGQGNLGPLPALCDLADEFGCIMMVDDAHASGVFGRQGRGTVDHFGCHGRVDIQVGTLSKAIGVLGGYVAGTAALIDFLHHRARPFLFSTSHPPAVTAACIAALRCAISVGWPRRMRFWRLFHNRLRSPGNRSAGAS